MSLSTQIMAHIRATLTGSPDIGDASYDTGSNALFARMANGTGASQADRMFSDRRTLAASANEDLDLAGALLNPLGGSAAFAKVKAIFIKAAAANTNNVIVKPGASNGFTGPFGAAAHTLSVPPGGLIMLAAPVNGWAVTAGTGDLINVANSGGSTTVTYDIVLIGTSA